MNEKIIIFGAGKKKDFYFDVIEKCGGFEVVEIWDNNEKMWGKKCRIGTDMVTVTKPYKKSDINIIIITDIYFDEIRQQLIDKVGIEAGRIKSGDYLYKAIKEQILQIYQTSTDEHIKKICEYLKKHDLDMFNGQITHSYDWSIFDVLKDEKNGLLFSYWKGKKLYLKADFKDEKSAQQYLCSLCREQDEKSPHSYHIEKMNFSGEEVVIDCGAAEGFFSLQIIDRVKKIYLVEADKEWVEALKCTFYPYRDKVEIVEKYIGDCMDENMITIDEINKDRDVGIIKMDIEGAERLAISGGEKTFLEQTPLCVIICTYHRSEDYHEFVQYFKQRGYDISVTDGYMFVGGLEEIKAELRKGVLTARKAKRI